MSDPRMERLARLLVQYSVAVQPGDKVLLETAEVPPEMLGLLVREIAAHGGIPFVEGGPGPRARRAQLLNASAEMFRTLCRRDLAFMKEMNGTISLRGSQNIAEMSDVPEATLKLAGELWYRPVSDWRVNNTKWCVLRWPTPAMAQLAGMSTEAFEDFYFAACTLDYPKMALAEECLVQRMQAADRVRIRGPGTDLAFSIRGIPAVPCCGRRNIPDGEVYTAPVRDSVNGVIAYNVPTTYHGRTFTDVRLVFKDGRISEAFSAAGAESLNAILDSDEGARFAGEFAIGVNPRITRPMNDILFDEKIAGSLHFTPGQAYAKADNGNRSSVHWDLVLMQTPEQGGGEIWFDDELIRRDGRFVPETLHGLNPENLSSP